LACSKSIFWYDRPSAWFLMKPMTNARPFFPVDARKIFAMRKQAINQCASFPPSSRMNRDSRRFIYNNQVGVFEENRERDRFRHEVNRLRRWFDQENAIARPNNVACTRHCAIDGDEPLTDKRLNSRTRKLVRKIGEKTIQPRARIRCFKDNF